MSPSSSGSGRVRPAAVVNEEIRRLWVDPRVQLTPQQRTRYLLLVAEYQAAKRAEAAAHAA
jgi:hypothetical protein